MSERIININGIFYVSRTNENGIYMVRVNADGTDWVNKPLLTPEEERTGVTAGPAQVYVAPAPRVSWWRRLFGFR